MRFTVLAGGLACPTRIRGRAGERSWRSSVCARSYHCWTVVLSGRGADVDKLTVSSGLMFSEPE
jgi:hypothetical protein